MNKEYIFNDPTMGGKTIIKLGNGTLTISRPGVMSKLSHGFSGEKTILFNQISAIQIKKAGIARGYIQFVLSGTKEARSGVIFGEKDENIVYFASTFNNKKTNNAAEEIKRTIEQYNLNNNKSNTIIKEDDKYDKLAKLKKLLDDNVITRDEFEIEKAKLLKL